MNVQFTIKDNFKLPRPGYGKGTGRPTKYPFSALSVGQTAILKPRNKRELTRIRAAVSMYASRNKVRFSTRKLGDGTFAVQRLRAKTQA